MPRLIRKVRKSFRHGEKGFTLIELLVVVAILGILAAVAVPNFTNMIGTGASEAANMEEKTVQTAVVAFAAANNGTYPTVASFPTAQMDIYFIGGVASLLGTYTLDGTSHVVTQTAYPGT